MTLSIAVIDQVLRTEGQLNATQAALDKALEDNRMLLLRIDQPKWENERLKDEVEMLSIDLGMK